MKNSIHFSLPLLEKFVETALEEDIGTGDITTDAIISKKETSTGRVLAKQNLIICGLEIFKYVFLYIDKKIEIDLKFSDGEKVHNGGTLLAFSGNTRSLLSGERVALNILQRLSGIATLTAKFVEKTPDFVKILDTRKTTPGMRTMEKYAVRCGGGDNHRFGLYDAILIKDNHIKSVGSITKAVEQVRKNVIAQYDKKNVSSTPPAPFTKGEIIPPSPPLQKGDLKIEVEVKSIKEVEEALSLKCDTLLLDNMTPEQIKEAVKIINKRALIEVSGNIGLHNVQEIAATGIDFISIGALTHSAPAVDISMVFD